MTAPLTGSLRYAYDRLGNRTRLVYPDGKVVTGPYIALNQMAGLIDSATHASGFAYSPNGQPLTTTLPNGLTGTVGVDTYTLDARQLADGPGRAAGARRRVHHPDQGLSYTYDHLYRATDVVSPRWASNSTTNTTRPVTC